MRKLEGDEVLVNASLAKKLDTLRLEYERLTGSRFTHFYCPILLRDEAVELCEGHVVNEAFPGSDGRTVVQRSDVDSFFGTKFEGEFTLLADRGRHSAVDLLLDRRLARKLRPQLLIDGQPIGHYVSHDHVPPHHSKLLVEQQGQEPIPLVLKLAPSEALSALDANWEVEISRDVRLAALVSLLKSAHLSMFALMGYSYALTSGGLFLGWEILGKFVARNLNSDRTTVMREAPEHFGEFVNLVRPMLVPPENAAGTVTDAQLFLCTGTPRAWAFMVLIRTGRDMHAVIIPIMEDEEGGARFARFLKDSAPRFEVKRIKFAGDRWEVAKTGHVIDWPEANFSVATG